MRTALLLIAALGLASCNGDSKVCTPIMQPRVPDAGDPPSATRSFILGTAEACLHKSAYRLASSSDHADTVARAVLAACDSAVDSAVAERVANIDQVTAGRDEAMREGLMNAAEENGRHHYAEFALMKVVEGRAGGCKV